VGIGAERRLTKAASLFPQGGFLSFVAMMIRFVGDCVVPIIILLNPSLFPRYRHLAFLVFISSLDNIRSRSLTFAALSGTRYGRNFKCLKNDVGFQIRFYLATTASRTNPFAAFRSAIALPSGRATSSETCHLYRGGRKIWLNVPN